MPSVLWGHDDAKGPKLTTAASTVEQQDVTIINTAPLWRRVWIYTGLHETHRMDMGFGSELVSFFFFFNVVLRRSIVCWWAKEKLAKESVQFSPPMHKQPKTSNKHNHAWAEWPGVPRPWDTQSTLWSFLVAVSCRISSRFPAEWSMGRRVCAQIATNVYFDAWLRHVQTSESRLWTLSIAVMVNYSLM